MRRNDEGGAHTAVSTRQSSEDRYRMFLTLSFMLAVLPARQVWYFVFSQGCEGEVRILEVSRSSRASSAVAAWRRRTRVQSCLVDNNPATTPPQLTAIPHTLRRSFSACNTQASTLAGFHNPAASRTTDSHFAACPSNTPQSPWRRTTRRSPQPPRRARARRLSTATLRRTPRRARMARSMARTRRALRPLRVCLGAGQHHVMIGC
jgi:hypothetical protein